MEWLNYSDSTWILFVDNARLYWVIYVDQIVQTCKLHKFSSVLDLIQLFLFLFHAKYLLWHSESCSVDFSEITKNFLWILEHRIFPNLIHLIQCAEWKFQFSFWKKSGNLFDALLNGEYFQTLPFLKLCSTAPNVWENMKNSVLG